MTDFKTQLRVLALAIPMLLVMAPVLPISIGSAMMSQPAEAAATGLPVISLDALEDDTWSVANLVVAPGQRLVVTNRDVERHNFTLEEWDIDIALLTLAPVEVIVPLDIEPGSSFTFTSVRNDEREPGMDGTVVVVTPEQVIAAADKQKTVSASIANRTAIEITNAFDFQPSQLHLSPGALLDVRNVGSIEHHFVIDAWQLNETIGPGEARLVRIPEDAVVGETLDFYCSIPGHEAMGMMGTLGIVPSTQEVGTTSETELAGRVSVDLSPFLPNPDVVGAEWTLLRTGNANAILSGRADFDEQVFPGEGLGGAYVGPEGSRVTIVLLPLDTSAVPPNQIRDSVQNVQVAMMQAWLTDRLSSTAMQRIPPPQGCDVSLRASGLEPVLTLPAGATACELRNAGIAIFVTVEGNIDGSTGVEASDNLIVRMLSGADVPAVGEG